MEYIPFALIAAAVSIFTLLVWRDDSVEKSQKIKIIAFLMVFSSFTAVIVYSSAGVAASEGKARKHQTEEIEASCALIKIEDREGLFGSSKAIYQCGNTQISRKIGSAKKAELIKKITSTDKI